MTVEPHRRAIEDTEPACYWLDCADRNQGRRGPWLKLLDALGMGFDS